MKYSNGTLFEIINDVDNPDYEGAHLIYDLKKWMSDDSDWESASKGKFLSPEETIIFLGEIGSGPDHDSEFGLFFTRHGSGWVAFNLCKPVVEAT